MGFSFLEKIHHERTKGGFSLIELLVVISIIGLLSSIVIANLNSARVRARDARRIQDMDSIYTGLTLFYTKFGYLPTTSGSIYTPAYSEVNSGGWDYSSQGGFLTFLQTNGDMSKVPVDPVNNMTGDGTPAGTFAYRYYCYSQPGIYGLHLGYWKESTGVYTTARNVPVAGADSSFSCR